MHHWTMKALVVIHIVEEYERPVLIFSIITYHAKTHYEVLSSVASSALHMDTHPKLENEKPADSVKTMVIFLECVGTERGKLL